MNRPTLGCRLALFAALASALAGCGQKGALYLPDEAREIVTRPTQAPPAESTPPESSQAPNSPQTVDSPAGPASPAPEVVAPDKKEKDKGTPPKP